MNLRPNFDRLSHLSTISEKATSTAKPSDFMTHVKFHGPQSRPARRIHAHFTMVSMHRYPFKSYQNTTFTTKNTPRITKNAVKFSKQVHFEKNHHF